MGQTHSAPGPEAPAPLAQLLRLPDRRATRRPGGSHAGAPRAGATPSPPDFEALAHDAGARAVLAALAPHDSLSVDDLRLDAGLPKEALLARLGALEDAGRIALRRRPDNDTTRARVRLTASGLAALAETPAKETEAP